MFGTGPAVPLVVDYGDNPITKNLKGGMTFYLSPAQMAVADKNKAEIQDVELVKISPQSLRSPIWRRKSEWDPKRYSRPAFAWRGGG